MVFMFFLSVFMLDFRGSLSQNFLKKASGVIIICSGLGKVYISYFTGKRWLETP